MLAAYQGGRRRAGGWRILVVLLVALIGVSLAPGVAKAEEAGITNEATGLTYEDLATAVAEASSGDTIKLGSGNYTLYGVSSDGHTKGKDLTFEGEGADKTAWNIGAEVPNPDNYGTEYNGDYSFDGAGTVTFKNMRLRSGGADYLGFIRANNTVVDGCVIDGKTFYWGYESATFTNTTFNAPSLDYAIWTYSSPIMTFDDCTFNATGKAVNVYTDFGAGKRDIKVNVRDCTFNSQKFGKQALNINDSNMGGFKYVIDIANSSATAARDKVTCSQLFGFGGKQATNNTGRTDVTVDGVLAWSDGKMQTHSYTDGEHDQAFNASASDWTSDGAGTWSRTITKTCKYCGYVEAPEAERAYDVSYDLNGSIDEQETDYSAQERNLPGSAVAVKDAPVRAGYVFEGWNTSADGSGASYAAGDELEIVDAPMTLYARWKKTVENPSTPTVPTTPASPTSPTAAMQDEKPSQKGKVLPQTGDEASAFAPLVLAGAAAALIGAGLLLNHRNS